MNVTGDMGGGGGGGGGGKKSLVALFKEVRFLTLWKQGMIECDWCQQEENSIALKHRKSKKTG